jgi:hypothetical protein
MAEAPGICRPKGWNGPGNGDEVPVFSAGLPNRAIFSG